jgi:hypothetical protein
MHAPPASGLTLTIAQCGRSDFDKMVAGAIAAIEAGVTRLDPMDSTNALSPQATTYFVREWRSRLVRPVAMTIRTYNEFGMITAAGASPDVALNGVSYRSGFARWKKWRWRSTCFTASKTASASTGCSGPATGWRPSRACHLKALSAQISSCAKVLAN